MSATKLDPEAVPKLKQGLKLQDASLSGEEGFLLSRIDGQVKVGDLFTISGFGKDKTGQLLGTLAERGLILLDGCEVKGPQGECQDDLPEEDRGQPWAGMKFNPFDLNAEVDLSSLQRKRILYLFVEKEKLSHYQMLNLDRKAEAKEVKRAYFRVSKDFHPDTYFRKNLGTFKSKIESIFKRISVAYEILSEPQKREAYDKTLPYEATAEELAKEAEKKKFKKQDDRLKNERRRRLMRRMPALNQKTKAKKHYEAALEAKQAKKFTQAANAVRLALTLDPNNAAYKKLKDEVAPQAGDLRYEEEMGNDEAALKAFLTAVECSSSDGRALHRAAKLMLKLDRDLRRALSLCRQAMVMDPDNADALETLGDVYLAMGMHKNALREYNRYVQLSPLDEHMQKKIDDLRKKTK
ncbi:MAG: DnaJ domain-containing protein [Deltaproteobacteria bacterium]|nr:DnaJ domain-containing protein [Deltaproteobacteria bacterium]